MCIPKSNHKRLINECYPSPKALATTAQQTNYRPNSNETSRLAYYGNQKPAKLTKVGEFLLARAQADAKYVKGTQASEKYKAGLMITLSITKNLITECSRQLNYFSSSAQSIISAALQAAANGGVNGKRDVELTARAASTFYALATFTNPSRTTVDSELDRAYQALVAEFAKIAQESNGSDEEERSRVRLIGLGALSGAVGSDALYTTSFPSQAAAILPALLTNLSPNVVSVRYLTEETSKASSGKPSYAEFNIKRQPMDTRRAPSISEHRDGEKGPSAKDAAAAAIGTLHGLMSHADGSNVQAVLVPVLAWLDGRSTSPSVPPPASTTWKDAEWCCWLANALSSWSALQYRFVVLTALVEHLVEVCDGPARPQHSTLLAMIASLLKADSSLIGLSTSDALNNLAGLAVRRVHVDTKDVLLPGLVESISALGVHIYYAEQITDMVDELNARIAALQLPQAGAADAAKSTGAVAGVKTAKQGDQSSPEQRDASVRVLLYCLDGVLVSARRSTGEVQKAVDGKDASVSVARAGARNAVSPEVWRQTAATLVSPNPSVRLLYEQVLVSYLQNELQESQKSPALADADNTSATSLAHVLGAAAYVTSLSRALYTPNSVKESPLEALVVVDRSNKDEGRALAADPATAANASDYAGISTILEALIKKAPVDSLLGLTPALIAIDKDGSVRTLEPERRDASRALVKRVLSALAREWNVSAVASAAGKLSSTTLTSLPLIPAPLSPSPAPASLSSSRAPTTSSPVLDAASIIDAFATSTEVQSATRLTETALRSWLKRDWSVAIAVDDAFHSASPYATDSGEGTSGGARSGGGGALAAFANGDDADADEDADRTHTNLSTTSGSNAPPRGTGVDDLREALGSRSRFSSAGPNGDTARLPSAGFPNGSAGPNGHVAAGDERVSRRVSRKISNPVNRATNPAGVLDAIVGGGASAGGEENGGAKLVPPYAA